MKTIRRFAHELYPHADEYEIRPLSVEVPYLYAYAIGHRTTGTDWFDLFDVNHRAHLILVHERTVAKIHADRAALFADAVHQGLSGDEAWKWAEARYDEYSSWVYERAVHYGVPVERIKPYPVMDEPRRHDHMASTGNVLGRGIVTRIDRPESECPECCEPDEAGDDAAESGEQG